MKLIKVYKKEEKVVVRLQLGTANLTSYKDLAPEIVNQLNDIVFTSKQVALDYWKANLETNQDEISKGLTRIGQLPTDALAQVNDFAAAIDKSNALSKRRTDKIESLLNKWTTLNKLESQIKEIKKMNEDIQEIIQAIEKVE